MRTVNMVPFTDTQRAPAGPRQGKRIDQRVPNFWEETTFIVSQLRALGFSIKTTDT